MSRTSIETLFPSVVFKWSPAKGVTPGRLSLSTTDKKTVYEWSARGLTGPTNLEYIEVVRWDAKPTYARPLPAVLEDDLGYTAVTQTSTLAALLVSLKTLFRDTHSWKLTFTKGHVKLDVYTGQEWKLTFNTGSSVELFKHLKPLYLEVRRNPAKRAEVLDRLIV